MDTLYIERISK